ncbi:MAG: alpha/beta fold hydrolase, partial [Stackebrandtia sp.]
MRQRRTWVAGVAAIVAAVIVGLSTATYPAAAEPSADGPHECADATKRCDGVIEVPLDWSNPSGEKIEVAFAFVPHADQSRPAEGAILGNPGGPGAAIGEDLIFDTALGPVLDTQDLFVVDPRGTGKSTPLRCDDLDLREPQTIRDCAAEIGDRVQFFTADQVAADMNAVRQALGLPAVTFYGNSYGTLFAQAFATRFPEQTRAVFVDSVVLTDEAGYADVFASGRAIRDGLVGFEAVCEESAACRALPGDAEERWADLVAHLRDNPDPEIDVFNLIRSNAY